MPPVETEMSSPHGPGRLAMWVLLAGLFLTGVLSGWTWHDAIQRDEGRFANMAEQVRQEFETRVERYEMGFAHLADWFVENELASDTEWENRIRRMNPAVNYPGVTEICYAPAVGDVNTPRWTGHAPAHWPPEAAWDSWSFPVWYQAVQRPGRNEGWGRKLRDLHDNFSNERSPAGVNGFLCSGHRLLIPSEDGRTLGGFFLATGSFRKDLPPDDGWKRPEYAHWPKNRGEQQRIAMLGMVMATIAMEPLLDSIFSGRNLEIDFEIHAGAVSQTNRLNRLDKPMLTPGRGLHLEKEIPWYFRRWTIVAAPNSLFFLHSQRGRAGLVAAAGILLSGAIAWLVRTQEKARSSAEAWGHSLEMAREELRTAHRERLQLGRDLHDGALQSIYASVLGLRRANRALLRDPRAAGSIIDGVVADLEATMQDVRRFLSSTRQEGIAPGELREILRGFVNAFNRIEQSRVTLDFHEDVAACLASDQAEQLLHVVKEGVGNAHRHGCAGEIQVAFRRQDRLVVLTIHDNGRGFDPGGVLGNGHGLQYMAERAALCRGTFGIQSKPGGPTLLRLEIRDSAAS